MKRITTRALVCLLLALMLTAGTVLFVFRFCTQSSTWVSYPANRHLYSNGQLTAGRIIDNSGTTLIEYNGGWVYRDEKNVRLSTIHAAGDPGGQIGTGALSVFASDLTGYNLLTGTGAGAVSTSGRDLHLTIDSELSAAAFDALKGHNGLVGVYNYKTGRILCMCSAPAYDPKNPSDSSKKSGAFINKLVSSTFTPGSIFKIVTTTAAIEKLHANEDATYQCTGKTAIGDYQLTCTQAHGTLTLEKALNQSCNCTFGQLAVELGSSTMEKYVESTGLTSSYSINGVKTAKSTFDFEGKGKADLAWSGVGQGKDLVNPMAMMVFCGAIGNRGSAALPQFVDHLALSNGSKLNSLKTEFTGELINSSTADLLAAYMKTDVEKNYGQRNFPGLNICAKSGTAEIDKTKASNGWFAGFLDDEEHPLAFICLVEEGGSGAKSAGTVINTVLQKAVSLGY